jgi:hypothetical protein
MAGVSGKNIERVIKARGKMRGASSKFLGLGRGQPRKKKGTSKMQKEKCERCLWNWPNVHTWEGHLCHHNQSARYLKDAGGMACPYFEYRVGEGGSK